MRAQQAATRLFSPTGRDRERQSRRIVEQRDVAILQHDQRNLVSLRRAGSEASQCRALYLAQRFLGALQLAYEQGPQVVALNEGLPQRSEIWSSPANLNDLQFLKRLRERAAAYGHDIVRDVVSAAGQQARLRSAHPTLGLELDAGPEPRRFYQCPQPARGLRRSG